MFKKGESVWIVSMGVVGKVIERKGERYVIGLERFTVECAIEDLTQKRPPKSKRAGRERKVSPRVHPALKPVRDKRPLQSLDLHGLRVAEALAVVEKRINDAILADLAHIEIVHGVGTGALLTAVHQYLSQLSVVVHYKLDPHNPGVTRVYFES